MKLLYSYPNGNYQTLIFDDGTKVRQTFDENETEFKPGFAESIDLKITDYCDGGCPMCYANSTKRGKEADLNQWFMSSFHKGQELAIGGGNPLSHSELETFLAYATEELGVIPNITVNEKHLTPENIQRLKSMSDNRLIYGIGLSYVKSAKKLLEVASEIPNVVFHVIAGYHSLNEIMKLAGENSKVLLLGYKYIGRGVNYKNNYPLEVSRNIVEIKNSLGEIRDKFKVLSFDNLAIEQLHPQSLVSKEQWDKLYMGDDGKYTFYIDAVTQTFSKNSLEEKTYPVMDSVDDMFKFLQGKENEKYQKRLYYI